MTVTSQPASAAGLRIVAHAPVDDDECFLHHIFDDRGAVAMAPGVAVECPAAAPPIAVSARAGHPTVAASKRSSDTRAKAVNPFSGSRPAMAQAGQ